MNDLEINFDCCPECDSLDISYRFLREEGNKIIYQGICRECDADWEDFDYKK